MFSDYHAQNPFGTAVSVAALVDDFATLDDWESRYRYLIELGRRLPPLPAALKQPANQIHGCQSQAWIGYDIDSGRIKFLLDSDAHIVRGLIAVVLSAVNDRAPKDIEAVDFDALFERLDLLRHLSPTRGNGLRAMVARIQSIARNQSIAPIRLAPVQSIARKRFNDDPA